MNQDRLTQKIQVLNRRRAELVSLEIMEKENALIKSGSAATGDAGSSDLGTDLAEQDIALRLAGIEHLEISRIDAALERARQGSYGVCGNCGQEIVAERLELVPEAAYCSSCEVEASKLVH